eukprot:CAMPEP_0115590670 /NCGR_PEP_ID=MMETSP0272-20121206/9886_1 /TAXON_ID=71861 /ORGANISM="Scrippsiella trochoidea, Strain CCMP3099" /LENGTH=175 /DNA_ID=CAMNT_0003025877 /DNA_START=117 /DNA_END=641 /DNA_ORIENTATION=-
MMWRVFTAGQTQTAWNFPLPIDAKHASRPKVAMLNSRDFVVSYSIGRAGVSMWSTLRAEAPFGRVSPLKTGSSSPSMAPLAVVVDDSILNESLPAGLHDPMAARSCRPGVLALLLPGSRIGTLEIKQFGTSMAPQTLWVTPQFPSDKPPAKVDFVRVDGRFLVVASNGTHAHAAF